MRKKEVMVDVLRDILRDANRVHLESVYLSVFLFATAKLSCDSKSICVETTAWNHHPQTEKERFIFYPWTTFHIAHKQFYLEVRMIVLRWYAHTAGTYTCALCPLVFFQTSFHPIEKRGLDAIFGVLFIIIGVWIILRLPCFNRTVLLLVLRNLCCKQFY